MFNFVANIAETVKGEFRDFKKLKEYHYVPDDPVCLRGIYKVIAKEPHTEKFPNPMGVIVYAVPPNELSSRNRATGNFLRRYEDRSERQSAINRNFDYIARVIVDPRFHRCGIGSKLLRDTIPLFNRPYIETLTPIDKYAGLFRKFGFECIYQPTPERYVILQNIFINYGIPREIWDEPDIVQYRIDHLSAYKHSVVHKAMKIFCQSFNHHQSALPSLKRTRFICSKIRYPNNYWLYRRKGVKIA